MKQRFHSHGTVLGRQDGVACGALACLPTCHECNLRVADQRRHGEHVRPVDQVQRLTSIQRRGKHMRDQQAEVVTAVFDQSHVDIRDIRATGLARLVILRKLLQQRQVLAHNLIGCGILP